MGGASMEDMSAAMMPREGAECCIDLPPGFRFHPTDEEIIISYLIEKVLNRKFSARAVGEVDLNKFEPWDLPAKAKMGEKEWYFFCQRDRKYPTGMRTNRATEAGYWKATGKDKEINKRKGCLVGMKKTLVFYKGRAPKGEKTNWVMHEFRLEGKATSNLPKTAKDEWVVCRVFHKNSEIKKTPESEMVITTTTPSTPSTSYFPYSPNLPPLTDSPYPNTTGATTSTFHNVNNGVNDFKGIITTTSSPIPPYYIPSTMTMDQNHHHHTFTNISHKMNPYVTSPNPIPYPQFSTTSTPYIAIPSSGNLSYWHQGRSSTGFFSPDQATLRSTAPAGATQNAASALRRQCKEEQCTSNCQPSPMMVTTSSGAVVSSVAPRQETAMANSQFDDDLDSLLSAGALPDWDNLLGEY